MSINLHSLLQTGTDYGPFLANAASPMHTTTLVDCCTRKLVADWRYLRENVSSLRNMPAQPKRCSILKRPGQQPTALLLQQASDR
jgi:hypothetical protein